MSNHYPSQYHSNLYRAVFEGDLPTLEAILEASETLDLWEAAEALALAASRDDRALVQCLLSVGLRPNHPQVTHSALHRATIQGHLTIVQMLLNARATVNQRDRDLGWTPLMYAACHGHLAIAQSLISAGADLNAGDHDGQTALMIAANAGQGTIALQLIQAGAQIALEDHYGNTVFSLAKQGCLPEGTLAFTPKPLAVPSSLSSPLSSPLGTRVEARAETARYATAA